MLSVAKTVSFWDTPTHFALQREMAGLRVGMVIVEVLNGPINGDDFMSVMMFVLNRCLILMNECLRKCNVSLVRWQVAKN